MARVVERPGGGCVIVEVISRSSSCVWVKVIKKVEIVKIASVVGSLGGSVTDAFVDGLLELDIRAIESTLDVAPVLLGW